MEKLRERLADLIRNSGKSKQKIEKEIGLGNGRLGKWVSGAATPNMENLNALAEYFGVSVDYLLCREESKNQHEEYKNKIIAVIEDSELNDEKLQLLEMYIRALTKQ